MWINVLTQFGLYLAVLLLLAQPLGRYMAKVYEGKCRIFKSGEQLFYRICAAIE